VIPLAQFIELLTESGDSINFADLGKESFMTTIAPDKRVRELDEETRRAWNLYRERLTELSGDDYEMAERESWAVLQNELRRLERRRRLLTVPTAKTA
jgi:hypothetical protein